MESRFSRSHSVVSNHYSNSHHSSFNQSAVVVQDVVVDLNRNRDRDRGSSSDSVAGVQSQENYVDREDSETVASSTSGGIGNGTVVVTGIPATSMAYLPQNIVLTELRHDAFEACTPSGPAESGLVSKWRPKDRVICFFCLLTAYYLLGVTL